jgi:predicted ester cyclase
MTSNQNRDIVNRMIDEIQNKKKIELCDELFSEDFVNHTPARNFSNDRAGMRGLFSMVHRAFPDGYLTVEDQISDAQKVWTKKMFTGTHTGMFGSISPTGKVVTYRVIDILAIKNGRMTKHWSVVDMFDLYQQLK